MLFKKQLMLLTPKLRQPHLLLKKHTKHALPRHTKLLKTKLKHVLLI
jgi:hypothetical protein